MDNNELQDESRTVEYIQRDESPLGPEGCLFPGNCCMPGPHYESKCHTPEMLMDQEEALNQPVQPTDAQIEEAAAILCGYSLADYRMSHFPALENSASMARKHLAITARLEAEIKSVKEEKEDLLKTLIALQAGLQFMDLLHMTPKFADVVSQIQCVIDRHTTNQALEAKGEM